MKNRCIYTKKVMREYRYAELLDYYRKLIIPFLIAFLLVFISFIVKIMEHDFKMFMIFYMIAPIIFVGMQIMNLEKVIKLNQQRSKVMYGKSDCECIVEFSDVIMMTAENKTQPEILYKHIIKYIETKNLIILILDGRMLVPLDKNGFIEGDAESCKKFIDNKIRKYKYLLLKKLQVCFYQTCENKTIISASPDTPDAYQTR